MTGVKTNIYLADLTHTGQTVSSNMFPLGIGLLGARLQEDLEDSVQVELYKYPEDLSRALSNNVPQIVGFSNYSWNCNLSYDYARRIKERSPNTVIVFGGPNYGLRPEETAEFWRRYPLVDFYVVKEGELAIVQLVKTLQSYQFDVPALKIDGVIPPNCHYPFDGRIREGEMLPRITSLEQIPSPYLMGMMDKFFDNVLVPMIHTTRGCPFTCTFCTEGAGYYNKVAQRTEISAELRYIAERAGDIKDLFITDANFGMFSQDREKAAIIASIQEEVGWPRTITVSTGKNRKDRIVEVASILNGSMSIGASLQSTDETVLNNISRTNISVTALNDIAASTSDDDTPTFTELIVGLPGDTLEKHTQSLRQVVDAGLGVIRVYQLIMLLQTELSTPETRVQYGMETKFRIMQRSLGEYDLFDQQFTSVESEEICINNNTMSFDDYIACRELDLTVELLHNDGTFKELAGLCKWAGIPWFDFLTSFHTGRRSHGEIITSLYDSFVHDIVTGLWETEEQLGADVKRNADRYLTGQKGINELANAKAVLFAAAHDDVRDSLYQLMEKTLQDIGLWDEPLSLYLVELKEFSRARMTEFFENPSDILVTFHFDFEAISDHQFCVDPRQHRLTAPEQYAFRRTADQNDALMTLVRQYGTSLDARGKILIRSSVAKLFRRAIPLESSVSSDLRSSV